MEGINGSSKESLNKYYFNCYLLVKIYADSDILGFICNYEVVFFYFVSKKTTLPNN